MKTRCEEFEEEYKFIHELWDELDEDLDRYTEEELEEIECREAFFHYGELLQFPEKNMDQYKGMQSKLYREGITGDRIVYDSDSVLEFLTKGNHSGNPAYHFRPWDIPVPNITQVDAEVDNYKLMRRCVKMLRNTPGGLRYDIKPPASTRLPNIKLHPRVESAIRSLLVETVKKQELRAKMDKVGYLNYKLNYKNKETGLDKISKV